MSGKEISGAASLEHCAFEQSIGLAQTSMRKVMGFKDGRTAAESLAARLRCAQTASVEGQSAVVLPRDSASQRIAANDDTPIALGRPEPAPASRPTLVAAGATAQPPRWWAGDATLDVEEISITAPDELQERNVRHMDSSAPLAVTSSTDNPSSAAWQPTAEPASVSSYGHSRNKRRTSKMDAAQPTARGVRLGWLFLALAGVLAVALLAWH